MELFSQKNKKVLWISIGAVAIFLTVLMIIGSFFDYQIAHAVGVEQFSFFYIAFGMFFEGLGFLPAILVNASLFATLVIVCKKKGFRILFRILLIVFLTGGVYCAIFWMLANHGIRLSDRSSIHHGISGGVSTVLGVILSFPFIKFFKKFDNDTHKKLIYVLCIGAVLGFLANATTGIMQPFWGRHRFYSILNYRDSALYNSLNPEIYYSPWFAPFGRIALPEGLQGYGFSTTSFPSMHASSVSSMIMLVLAGWVLGFNKKKMNILWVVTIVMLVAVPLSRMVLRWHFLTDVVFSLIIGLVSFIIGILVIDYGFGKKMKKFVNEPIDNDVSELSNESLE
ncbi:MAG: phosphatase PAP2 family protein [Firmicutes bacterium]|nr:phosphatase PAP2 family protein [Bacillota bacterium]